MLNMGKLISVCVSVLVVVAAVCVVVLAVMIGIMRNPGPSLEIIPESRKIWYNYAGRNDDVKPWTDKLNDFIDQQHTGYPDNDYEYSNFKDCTEDNRAYEGQVCKFDYEYLGDHCTKAENWGYSRNSPCVLLKMNTNLGWVPEVYRTIEEVEAADMPSYLVEDIKRLTYDNGGHVPQMLWVSCKGETPTDIEWIRKIEYTPWQGFPIYYFPDMKVPGYLTPIVALRFIKPATDVVILITCQVHAKNIESREISVRFSLGINMPLPSPTGLSDLSLLIIGIVCGIVVFISGTSYLLVCYILAQRRARAQ